MKNRRCSLWNGFEFCHKTLGALIADTRQAIWPRRRRAAAKEKKERRKENENGRDRRAFIDSSASLLVPYIDTPQMCGAYGNRPCKETSRPTFGSNFTFDLSLALKTAHFIGLLILTTFQLIFLSLRFCDT
ncbi:hypothetical protein PUN28_006958 [Cardiocondyla obscurior]|uniref:Transmembrane protein n=1 Tax=Cardiocondyla obscurior TaxID=286306 RepID=A0AAW2G720_9HYME